MFFVCFFFLWCGFDVCLFVFLVCLFVFGIWPAKLEHGYFKFGSFLIPITFPVPFEYITTYTHFITINSHLPSADLTRVNRKACEVLTVKKDHSCFSHQPVSKGRLNTHMHNGAHGAAAHTSTQEKVIHTGKDLLQLSHSQCLSV